jgi:hypothetical protein
MYLNFYVYNANKTLTPDAYLLLDNLGFDIWKDPTYGLRVFSANINKEIYVYPNPGKGNYQIKMADGEELKELKVYDMMGRELKVNVDLKNKAVTLSEAVKTSVLILEIITLNSNTRQIIQHINNE